MEPELKQALENINGKLDSVDKRLEKIEDRYEDQVKTTIQNQMRIEEINRDLEQHKEMEAQFGRQFDGRIKDQETKVSVLEKTMVKYSVIVGVIVMGGNQGIEAIKGLFSGG